MVEDIQALIIDLSMKYGGASVRALTLAKHLSPWNVAIAGLENSPVVNVARQRDIPVRIVGKSRIDPFIPWRLAKVIHEEQFQIIDTQNIPSKFWASCATLLTDVGFVSTLNSSYKDEFGDAWRGKIYTWLDRWTNFNVDRYIAVSRTISDNLIEAGISQPRVDLITNVVDVDDSLLTMDRSLVRRNIGIPDDAVLCVSVGRLVWAKGYEDLIDAFALIADRVPKAYVVIVGGGVLYPSLVERIQQSGLEDRVKLLGQCDVGRTWSVMQASDVFVMTSRSEGVPYALLEAAALELPILSTWCGGIPEIFTDNKDALLVPIGDLSAISDGLSQLCEDRSFAQTLAANARTKVKSEFSLSTQIAAVRQTYTKVLDNRPRRMRNGFSIAWHR